MSDAHDPPPGLTPRLVAGFLFVTLVMSALMILVVYGVSQYAKKPIPVATAPHAAVVESPSVEYLLDEAREGLRQGDRPGAKAILVRYLASEHARDRDAAVSMLAGIEENETKARVNEGLVRFREGERRRREEERDEEEGLKKEAEAKRLVVYRAAQEELVKAKRAEREERSIAAQNRLNALLAELKKPETIDDYNVLDLSSDTTLHIHARYVRGKMTDGWVSEFLNIRKDPRFWDGIPLTLRVAGEWRPDVEGVAHDVTLAEAVAEFKKRLPKK